MIIAKLLNPRNGNFYIPHFHPSPSLTRLQRRHNWEKKVVQTSHTKRENA